MYVKNNRLIEKYLKIWKMYGICIIHGDTQNENQSLSIFMVQHGDTQNKNQVYLFFLVQHEDTQNKINFVYFFGTTWGYTK